MAYGWIRLCGYVGLFLLTIGNGEVFAKPVTITTPANGASVSGTVTITVSTAPRVARVDTYVDGKFLASSPPNTFSWDSSSAKGHKHRIAAKAFGPKGGLLGRSVIVVHTQKAGAGITNYYIDSINGSDSNNGRSPNSAWQSLSKVQDFISANHLKPGVSILFARGGVWSGGLTLPTGINGTVAAPITFGNYGAGALPRFDGGRSSSACFYARGTGSGSTPRWSYITIDGFECRNQAKYGVLFYQNQGGIAAMPGIIVKNMYIHDTGPRSDDGNYRNQLMFLDENKGHDGVQFLNNIVGSCGGHNCIQVQMDLGGPVIKGNTCYGWIHNCIDVKAVAGAIVENNIVHGPARAGAAFYLENTEVAAADVTWRENVVYKAPIGFECEGGGGSSNQSATCRAYNNTAYLGSQTAIVTGSDCSQPITWDVRNNILDTSQITYMPSSCSNRSVIWNYNDDCGAAGTCTSEFVGRHDMNGINPEFVNAGGNPPNFHLQPGSPLINAGLKGLTSNANIGAY
jgi:hypothetical protein